jgi:hypothetical protein
MAVDWQLAAPLTLRYAWLDKVHRVNGDDAIDPLARERDLSTHLINLGWKHGAQQLVGYAYLHDDHDVASASSTTYGVRWTGARLREGVVIDVFVAQAGVPFELPRCGGGRGGRCGCLGHCGRCETRDDRGQQQAGWQHTGARHDGGDPFFGLRRGSASAGARALTQINRDAAHSSPSSAVDPGQVLPSMRGADFRHRKRPPHLKPWKP